MKKVSTHDRGSTATKCIEEAWTKLRELNSHLPRAVIVLHDAATRNHKRGHFAQSAWQSHGQSKSHEIGISPALFGSPKEVLQTLLHEAAHALNCEKKVSDCSGRYYHRKQFRDMCKHLGLDCKFRNTRYGWSITGWPKNRPIPPCYLPIIEHLQTSLPRGAGVQPSLKTRGKRLPKTGHVRLECRCPRSLYANHTIADKGGIVCSICGSNFRRSG